MNIGEQYMYSAMQWYGVGMCVWCVYYYTTYQARSHVFISTSCKFRPCIYEHGNLKKHGSRRKIVLIQLLWLKICTVACFTWSRGKYHSIPSERMEIHWMLFAPRRTDIHAEAENLKLNKMFICKAKNSQLLIAYIWYIMNTKLLTYDI